MIITVTKTNHHCKRCGKCCRKHPQPLGITPMDILQISKFLGICKEQFLQEYCKIVDYSEDGKIKAYALKENNYVGKKCYCVFYDSKKGCKIHDVSPKQCRQYPFIRIDNRYIVITETLRVCGKNGASIDINQYLAQHPRNTPLEWEMSALWEKEIPKLYSSYSRWSSQETKDEVFKKLHLGLKEMKIESLQQLFNECNEIVLHERNEVLKILGIKS